MANLGISFIKQTDDWIKVADLYEGFAFEVGKTYNIQLWNEHRICIKNDGETPERFEGFECYQPITYTHQEGAQLWVKAFSSVTKLNLG